MWRAPFPTVLRFRSCRPCMPACPASCRTCPATGNGWCPVAAGWSRPPNPRRWLVPWWSADGFQADAHARIAAHNRLCVNQRADLAANLPRLLHTLRTVAGSSRRVAAEPLPVTA